MKFSLKEFRFADTKYYENLTGRSYFANRRIEMFERKLGRLLWAWKDTSIKLKMITVFIICIVLNAIILVGITIYELHKTLNDSYNSFK